MKRALLVIPAVLVMSAMGCGARGAPGATQPPAGQLITVSHWGGCYLSGPSGTLVKDSRHLVAFQDVGHVSKQVAWPEGYTVRSAGEELEVLDTEGNVAAVTGRSGYTYPMSGEDLPFPPGFDGLGICGMSSPGPGA